MKDRAEMENTVQKLSLEFENSKVSILYTQVIYLSKGVLNNSVCVCQSELNSRQTVSVEIAKALEETRKQREELQQQVCNSQLRVCLRVKSCSCETYYRTLNHVSDRSTRCPSPHRGRSRKCVGSLSRWA